VKVIRPEGWPRPRGYSHATAASGTTVFISGQIGWDEHERFVADDIAGQTRQALQNIVSIVTEAGGTAESVARMTWYVVDKRDYLAHAAAVGAAYRDVMGKHFPAMSVVEVAALVEDRALVEIEATAVVERRGALEPERR
jgi:enamine deaminase RidA (YjgF/YER057c/UK114 family)